MKKFYTFASALLFGALIASAASTVTLDGLQYTLNDDGTAKVTKFVSGTEFTIPATIEDEGTSYTVTELADRLFYSSSSFSYNQITKIEIPGSVKKIGGQCFYNCKKLETVILNEGLEDIQAQVFYNCAALKTITLPSTLTKLGSTYAGRLGDVEGGVFYGANTLETVNIPASVTELYGQTFYQCYGLENVTGGENLTALGKNDFYHCDKLAAIDFPKVETLGDATSNGCFSYCNALKSVKLPSLKVVYTRAFDSDAALETVELQGVETINASAFDGCSGLKTVVLGSTLTSIDSQAFSSCGSLEKISCMAVTPPTVASDAFNSAVYTKATLEVPTSSKSAYAEADVWKEFENVDEVTMTGVQTIENVENAPAVYYNLQGVRVENPANGLFVKVQGSKVSKVVIK